MARPQVSDFLSRFVHPLVAGGELHIAAPIPLTDSERWEVDLDGRPSNPIGDRGRSASIMASCAPKGTQAADRAEMMKRGITPTRVEVTGKQ